MNNNEFSQLKPNANVRLYRVWIRTEHSEGTLSYEDVEATDAAAAERIIRDWLGEQGYTNIMNRWGGEDDAVVEKVEDISQRYGLF
jgi:hypothetical protein